ncbi:MAG: hypothetical protein ACE5HJ_05365 [Thermoplasmata archaeon]
MLAREVAQDILSLLPAQLEEPSFALVGVGGAGINVLMEVNDEVPLRRITVDTDEYFLALCGRDQQLDLGRPLLEGKGTGGEIELGRSAAMLHRAEIDDCLGEDILLLVAGLGRGTGTGAAPVVASIAKEKGLPVLAFLIWPFKDERTVTKAGKGLAALKPHCDALLVLDNSAALEVGGVDTHREAATLVNTMMAQMVERLVERISEAFPFSVHEEITNFVEGLPTANEKMPLKAAELAFENEVFAPIAMDRRGIIELR